ncbi:MAG TPA: T9SS type A sorting domain-containing protein [Lentimicrobium sp.]|nr:T9SS type A sorting domain-containing protein [Lentimicrobium sp.]
MKKFLLVSLALSISYFSYSTSITVNGIVAGNWNTDTVFVRGNLVIPQNEHLTINPGSLILFQGFYRIDVYGSINAEGTLTDTIVFKPTDTTEFHDQIHGRGGWSGIRFRELNSFQDSSIFTYCNFQYGKATEDSLNSYGGAIMVYGFNKIRVSNCLFYHNYSYYSGGAIYLKEADIIIRNCTFHLNFSGNTEGVIYGYGGGICSMYSSAIIQWNKFIKNSSTGVGGGVSFDNSNPKFDFNIMEGNFSGLGGALGVLRSSPVNTFANNLVVNNEAMFFGGGICCIRSFPVFSNFTVTGNSSSYGGAFYCNDSAAPKMYNSIMWGNLGIGQSVYIWDVFSAPNFYNCDIEGDTINFEGSGAHLGYHGEYLNNLNVDPQFYGSGNFPFMLISNSLCIDSGTHDPSFLNLPPIDLAGNIRVYNNRLDIGAYEFNGTTSTWAIKNDSLLIYPNPFIAGINIKIPQNENYYEKLQLVIYNIEGKLVCQLDLKGDEIEWDGMNYRGLPVEPGLYALSLKIGNSIVSTKIIKMK